MFEHLVHAEGLGVGLHHLPALYMLEFHMVVLAAVATSVVVTMLVLLPAMRKAAPTVFVVSTCLSSGFLAAYSLLMPDWMSSSASLPPAPLGFHDWMASPPLSLRLYDRQLGLHVGLSGANVTMLATPIQGPAGCTPPLKRRPHTGCFAELNPRQCPSKSDPFSSGLLTIRHSRAERLAHMFSSNLSHGQHHYDTPSTARKLLWHEWSDDVEEAYRAAPARRSKPVHFSRAAGGNGSSASPAPSASSTGRKTTALGPGRRLGPCGVVGPGLVPMGPAWFDERVDWEWGSGPGKSLRTLLKRGVPGPVLALAEYLSRPWDYGSGGGEGEGLYAGSYDWGGRLRKAGHWTSCVLTASLVLWAFSLPLQMAEPESGAKLLGAAGLLMLVAAPLYSTLCGAPGGPLRVEGVALDLRWGACFYCSVLGGVWATLCGFGLAAVRHAFPGALATDLDLEEVHQRTAKVRPIV